MIDRRTVLLSSMAAVAASLLPTGAEAKVKRKRYNVASPEGQKMLAIYAKAVNKMKALSDQDPLSWTFQWFIHAAPTDKDVAVSEVYGSVPSKHRDLAIASWWTCQPHSKGQPGDYFLPWHRLYVMQFEEIIRQISGVPEFTLPYWDYTNPLYYAIPPQFQKISMNDPKWAPLFVVDRNVNDPKAGYADVNYGEPLNKYFGLPKKNPLVLPNMHRGYSKFCNDLDKNLHGNVHVLTGNGQTNMGVIPWAAKDPIFWLHHCNVDRIWYAWSVYGGENPTETKGTSWQDIRFTFPTSKGTAQDPSFSSVADINQLPYEYETLPPDQGKRRHHQVKALQPQVLAASNAGAAPAALAATDKKIDLTDQPLTVTLSALAGSQDKPKALLQTEADGDDSFVLVLTDVTAIENPGALFDVYLNVGKDANGNPVQKYAGLLNFFSLVKHKHGEPDAHSGHGQSEASQDATFDITDLVVSGEISSEALADLSITLVSLGTIKPGSMPQIGGIELRRE